MSKRSSKTLLALLAVILAAASASAAVQALSDPDSPDQFLQAVAANAAASYPVVRANGGDPDQAQTVGTTSRGIGLSVVSSDTGRCVLFSDANQFCAADDQVLAGRASSVGVDCSRAGGQMDVTALVPAGTADAIALKSDGATVRMQLARDVAWLDALAPVGTQAAYIAVRPLGADGRGLGDVRLPTDLCPGG